MYNKHSLKATEFIDDEEIKETLRYAQENKHNEELISALIERAKDCKGLTQRKMKKCLHWRNRSSRSCTGTVSLCLHRCICLIIV